MEVDNMYWLVHALVLGVVFVNGWTDAPNAITCIVSTGALRYGKAVRMAAVCDLLGILLMGLVSTSVADTVTGIVRLDPARPNQAVAVLCAAMAAIILFAVTAWFFGIPTSESHALIAALTGAAMAQGRLSAVNLSVWGKVLWGLGLSLVAGFGLGWLVTKALGGALRKAGDRALNTAQILSGAGMAFMHGAHDGQKFIAVLILANCLSRGTTAPSPIALHNYIPAMLLCAGVMALGTLAGGRRIIASVGGKMVSLQKYQGACADISGALCLLMASLFGVPMSTTHTKTTAIMGAGLAAGGGRLDLGVVRGMFIAWLFTFPVCGMIGYLAASLLMHLL